MLPGKKHHQTLLFMTQLQLGENGQKGQTGTSTHIPMVNQRGWKGFFGLQNCNKRQERPQRQQPSA